MDAIFTWIENNRYVAIALLTFFVLLIALLVVVTKKKEKVSIDVTAILSALGKDNIQSIRFVRNKLNVEVNDVKKANMDQLKASGAIGINLVGNKIKFYYEEDNEALYESLLQIYKEQSE